MASLFRNSRNILTRFSYVYRTSATTSTPGGGTSVKSSGASTTLSQASRMGDGTDSALKDASQRSTSADPIKPKPTGGSTNAPKADKASTPWGTIGFGVILAAAGYFAYINYFKNSEASKNLNLNKDAHGQTANKDPSAGKKH